MDAVNIPESGVHIAFIGSALWGLVAGFVLYAVLLHRNGRAVLAFVDRRALEGAGRAET